jgi:peptide/nickel transport system substrate-binding protein
MKRFKLLMTAMVASLAVVGVTSVQASSAKKPTPAPLITHGGSVTVMQGTESRSLDAAILGVSAIGGGVVGNALYDYLLRIDPYTQKIYYELATSLTSKDGINWTMTLRPNVHFSDGTLFDANAVKFSWQRLTEPALASPFATIAKGMTNITVTGADSLTFTLSAANYNFPYLLESSGGLNWINSPTAVRSEGASYGTNPVGAGPFTLKSWTPNSSTVMVRNPNYWQKGLPYLDQLSTQFNSDTFAQYDAVNTNQAQALGTSLLTNYAKAKKAGLKEFFYPVDGGIDIVFNVTRPPFNDVRARMAVCYALSNKFFDSAVFNGTEILANTLFGQASPFYNKTLKFPQDNTQKAQDLLNQLAADGKPLSFTFMANSTTNSVGMANEMTTLFGKLKNVTVNIANYDLVTYGTKLTVTHDFDVALGGAMSVGPTNMWNYFHTGGGSNYMQWSDPQADKALDDAQATKNLAQQKKDYTTLQQRLTQQVPIWMMTRSVGLLIYSSKLAGVQLYGTGASIWTKAGYIKK